MFNPHEFAARLSTRKDRWSLLQDFIAEWHSPLEPGDGYSASELDAAEQRLGLKLPIALREWYQIAGHREDVFATQNFLVCPEELEIEDGLLEFYSENQGVVSWGIQPAGLSLLDPPVWLNNRPAPEEPQEHTKESTTLSEFALQMAICETIITREPLIISSRSDEDATTKLEKVKREYVYLGFPDWHWPNYPVRFYGTDNTLALTIEEKWLYVAANTQAAFTSAKEFLELK